MRIRVILVTALAVVAFGLPAGEAASSGHVQEVVTFDPGAFEFPEGISFNKTGDAYVSMISLDQIWRISPDGSQSVMATIPAPGFGVAGLKVTPRGDVYVAVAAMDMATGQSDPDVRGVYRVTRAGVVSRLPGTEAMVFPNDVTIDERGNIYATDTASGSVWRIPRRGEAQLWSAAPELSGNGSFGFGFRVGANGIATWRREVLVGNSELGSLISIPIRPDGAAGPAQVIKTAGALVGVDGIALDVHGTVYAASGLQNLLTRVTRAGAVDVLATAKDGLNQPSTLAFGTAAGDQKNLYLLNFSVFPAERTPAVLRVRVGVPGAPVP